MLPNVRKTLSQLRERSKIVRQNNKKIDTWVDELINRAAMTGEAVTILTQWCISKDLEVRRELQNGFVPTKAERKLFERDLPEVAELFTENGLGLNWIITFNRSYLDSGRISIEVEDQYKKMVAQLAAPLLEEGWLMLLDWEEDVLGSRPMPDEEVMQTIEKFVPEGALRVEIERHSAWAKKEAKLDQSDDELKQDVFYQIACEAQEGLVLMGENSPLGTFILVPLESPERYDFFTLKVPSFKERIVPVLPTYPWRLS